MKTYARYTNTQDWIAKRVGNEWHEVTEERKEWRPSGLHTVVVINGLGIKACYCEIVTVFEK